MARVLKEVTCFTFAETLHKKIDCRELNKEMEDSNGDLPRRTLTYGWISGTFIWRRVSYQEGMGDNSTWRIHVREGGSGTHRPNS